MCFINFSPFPVLTTEHLFLRQLQAADENEFFILKSDERVLKYLNYRAKTFEESKQFIRRLNDDISRNECIIWGITEKGKDKIVGTICLWNISKENSSAEVGYELIPEHQGRGVMDEALKAVIKYGFEIMKLNSIEGVPNKNHLKSRRLLERNNFIEEGKISENSFSDGDPFEMIVYRLRNMK